MALLPLDDERAADLLSSVPEAERSDCWWLVLPDGTLVRGDHGGAVRLLSALSATRPLGRSLHRLRLSAVLDVLDKGLAKTRGRLSRFVPDGPAPIRFP